MPSHRAVVAVICSVWRPGSIVHDAITAAMKEPCIDQVLVFGYDPTGNAGARSIPRTLYHSALSRHLGTTDVLCSGSKFCTTDDEPRIRWRAGIALDMWACLTVARKEYPTAALVWLENDAVLIPGRLEAALDAAYTHGAAACYGHGKRYDGSGALCFVFTPAYDPTAHILSYHLVQPVDWIISDFSRGTWPIVPAVHHGNGSKEHVSTRLL